ncbi:MAG: hypothetical protein V1886_01990 [archaeon]
MPDNDLVVAIKNALERGQKIEQAMSSLLNAGYSKEEIEDAARSALAKVSIQSMTIPAYSNQIPSPNPQKNSQQPMQNQAKKPKKIFLLIIILLAIAALGIAAFLVSMLL